MKDINLCRVGSWRGAEVKFPGILKITMTKSKGPGPGMKKWGCRSRGRVIWGSIFAECFSLGEKPHLPQLSQSNLCLSKDTGSLNILAFLLIPIGYPLIWLGHMKACGEALRPIWRSCPLSAAERAPDSQRLPRDVQAWPGTMPGLLTSGERLAKSAVPKPNVTSSEFCQVQSCLLPMPHKLVKPISVLCHLSMGSLLATCVDYLDK